MKFIESLNDGENVSEIYFVLLYRTQEAHMANKELNRLKVLLVEMDVLTNSLLSSGEKTK